MLTIISTTATSILIVSYQASQIANSLSISESVEDEEEEVVVDDDEDEDKSEGSGGREEISERSVADAEGSNDVSEEEDLDDEFPETSITISHVEGDE